MKNVKNNQTKGVKSNEGKKDAFILKYAIGIQTSYKVRDAIRDALNELKVKYDAKPFASSFYFFGESFTIKIFNSRYELGNVEVRMEKYDEEIHKVLEVVINAGKKYYVENTQNRVFYSHISTIELEKPVKLSNARQNSNKKLSYESNGQFFSILTTESVDVNIVEQNDTSIKYTQNIKLSTEFCKGTLQFMPVYMAKLFGELNKLKKMADDYKEVA